jgi:hypothetical protein
LVERFQAQTVSSSHLWRTGMSNLDNQPGRDNRSTLETDSPTRLDDRRSGIGTGTITAIIAAAVIAGALMLFGPWAGNNRTAVNNSTSATSSSVPGTTTGQTSTAPRVSPGATPPAPSTTAPAPNAR